jgi:hypothetical protein
MDETKYRGPFQTFHRYASFQPFQWFKSFNDELSAFSHFNLEPWARNFELFLRYYRS